MKKEELVERINKLIAGDESEFEPVYLATKGDVMRILRKCFPKESMTTLEDVLQETYFTVSLCAEKIDAPEKFVSWVAGIAKHKELDAMAKNRDVLMTPEMEEAGALENTPDTAWYVDPEQHALASEMREDIKSALLGVTGIPREAFEMFFMSELKMREIASELDVPEGTVKSRINTGRKRFICEYRRKHEGAADVAPFDLRRNPGAAGSIAAA